MILEVGTINLDHIITCQHLPEPKESILCKDVTLMLGGKGANQIAAAGRLGAETILISMIGENDPNNTILFHDLNWAGDRKSTRLNSSHSSVSRMPSSA